MSVTRQQLKIIDAAEAIRAEPDKAEAAFLARQLVQATLPHKDPGNVPLWKRTNGKVTLAIQAGMDVRTGKSVGYPYGVIPRLLLFWISTEALRKKERRLELGNSLSSFMKQLGLNSANGGTGAKRSDARRLREQMERLFRARISFDQSDAQRSAWMDMQVAPKGVLWWDEKQPEQGTLWESWVQLSEEFYEAITAAPVPVDMRALKALKNSPLALDLYAWATFTAFQTQRKGQTRSISWDLLQQQFGAEYKDTKDFKRNAWKAFEKIQVVYPELGIEKIRGGLQVLPCNPAVTIRPKAKPKPKSGDKS